MLYLLFAAVVAVAAEVVAVAVEVAVFAVAVVVAVTAVVVVAVAVHLETQQKEMKAAELKRWQFDFSPLEESTKAILTST